MFYSLNGNLHHNIIYVSTAYIDKTFSIRKGNRSMKY